MRTRSFKLVLILLTSVAVGRSQPAPAAPAAPAASTDTPVAAAKPAETPAAVPTTDVAPKPAEAAAAVQTTDAASNGASRNKDTMSVDYPDEDIRTILRNVADLFELNLVIPPALQGKTSIKLHDVTWRQVFDVILTPVGYTFIDEGGIIKIVSLDSLAEEPVATEVFILSYAKASEVQTVISTLIESGKGGKLTLDTRSNSLIVTERPSKLNKIRPIIKQLDKATEQVMIETKFVEVENTDAKNIGVNWSSLSGYQLGVGGIGQSWTHNSGVTRGSQNFGTATNNNGTGTTSTDGTTSGTANGTTNGTSTGTTNGTSNGSNSSIQTGTQTVVTTSTNPITGDVTTNVTQVPQNTNTQGTTSSVTTGNTSGSSGSTTASTTLGTTAALNNTASDSISNVGELFNSVAYSSGTARVASAVFSASDFSIVLSALKTFSGTKIVSNPTVVTLNNTEAFINVGEEFPIPQYTYNQERGGFEVSGFAYKPIGIILTVTPQVNASGFIKLTVEPTVSERTGTASFGGAGGAQIPIISERKAKTQVSMKDGYTMAIGGLLKTQTTNGGSKIPVLGDIPLLGKLFSSSSKDDETSNLIIFITAKSISSEGGRIEDTMSPDQIRGLSMRREDLPGYRGGPDPFLLPEKAGKAGR